MNVSTRTQSYDAHFTMSCLSSTHSQSPIFSSQGRTRTEYRSGRIRQPYDATATLVSVTANLGDSGTIPSLRPPDYILFIHISTSTEPTIINIIKTPDTWAHLNQNVSRFWSKFISTQHPVKLSISTIITVIIIFTIIIFIF